MKVIFEVSNETTPTGIIRMAAAMSALGGSASTAAAATTVVGEKLDKVKEDTTPGGTGKAADKKVKKEEKVDPADQEPDGGKEDKPITMEKIRALVQAKAVNGHKDAIKEALETYNVAKVPDLKKEDYAAFYETVNNL